MKKSILVFLAAVQVCSVSIPAFAANETAQTYDVTMSVGANVVRSTDEKVFGYNMEWGVSPLQDKAFGRYCNGNVKARRGKRDNCPYRG